MSLKRWETKRSPHNFLSALPFHDCGGNLKPKTEIALQVLYNNTQTHNLQLLMNATQLYWISGYMAYSLLTLFQPLSVPDEGSVKTPFPKAQA
jgi:hypothetical protein